MTLSGEFFTATEFDVSGRLMIREDSAEMRIPAHTLEFHVSMLNDRARTEKFCKAIARTVRPKDVVLDIGTGTGILAVASALAGAKHVFALETGGIASVAEQIVKSNGLDDRITVIKKTSTLAKLPVRADVVVSELIGNEPLSERIVPVLVDARRRLLQPDARFVPRSLRIFAVPISTPRNFVDHRAPTTRAINSWLKMYGCNFAPLNKLTQDSLLRVFVNPCEIAASSELSDPVLCANIRFSQCQNTDIRKKAMFKIKRSGLLSSIVFYFELSLGEEVITTRPCSVDRSNHWLSPVWITTSPYRVNAGDRFDFTYRYDIHGDRSFCIIQRIA